jgi:hypothetical protein
MKPGDRVYVHFTDFFDADCPLTWKPGTVALVFAYGSSDDFAKVQLDRPFAGDVWSTRLVTALRPFGVVERLADLA